MRRTTIFFMLLFIACGSAKNRTTSRPATIPQPEIDLFLTHTVFYGSGSSAPATIEVKITNRAKEPIMVRLVEVYTPTMVTHGLVRTQRVFHDTIPAGETKSVTVFATAVTTIRDPSEPLVIHALIDFEGGGTRWREHIRVAQ